jgi:hypothetical protein
MSFLIYAAVTLALVTLGAAEWGFCMMLFEKEDTFEFDDRNKGILWVILFSPMVLMLILTALIGMLVFFYVIKPAHKFGVWVATKVEKATEDL